MGATPSHNNNFDILRLLAAWLILFGHSFELFDRSQDPLASQLHFDSATGIALSIFFVISGYLVTASYERAGLWRYAVNRALRILPGLIVVVILTVLLLGTVTTTLPLTEYYSMPQTWDYFKTMSVFSLRYELPGVFQYNPYPDAVNGSLWSLKVEARCYLYLAVLGICWLLKRRVLLLLIAAILFSMMAQDLKLADLLDISIPNAGSNGRWYLAFVTGAALYLYEDQLQYRLSLFLAALLVALIAWYVLPQGKYIYYLLLPYLILSIAYCPRTITFLRGNDISYGVYLYAFPVQQLYMYFIGRQYGIGTFIAVATVITFVYAWASWKLIEQPCLRLKSAAKK